MESLVLGLLLSNFCQHTHTQGLPYLRGLWEYLPPLLEKLPCPPSSSHGFVPKILILSLLCSFWQLYTKYPPQDDFYVALPKVWSIFLGGASTSICHFFHLSVRLSVRSSVAHQSQVSGTVHHLIIIFGTHIV